MSTVQDLLHRGPVRLNPPAVMAAVPVWRDPNLRELSLCPAGYLFEVEDGDRIVVRPPTCGAPCLDNLLPRLEHQIVATEMSFPGTELASHFLADDCLLARQRRMLLGVADELVDLPRRGVLEGHRLYERPGLHVVLSNTAASPRSGEAADSQRGGHDLSRSPRIVPSSSRTLMGLPWKPSKPAAMILWRSWAMTDAVTAMTGIARVVGSARSSLSASIPLMPAAEYP